MSAGEWIAIAGLCSGLLAFTAGLWQYRRAQKWTRLEFIALQMKEFYDHPMVADALKMLDWNEREYKLPDGRANEPMVVNDEILTEALTPHMKNEAYPDIETRGDFPEPRAYARDCFDELLGQLDEFWTYIESGLVTAKEFEPHLRYWLDVMTQSRGALKPEETIKKLWLFIDIYGYDGVRNLADAFGYPAGEDVAPGANPDGSG